MSLCGHELANRQQKRAAVVFFMMGAHPMCDTVCMRTVPHINFKFNVPLYQHNAILRSSKRTLMHASLMHASLMHAGTFCCVCRASHWAALLSRLNPFFLCVFLFLECSQRKKPDGTEEEKVSAVRGLNRPMCICSSAMLLCFVHHNAMPYKHTYIYIYPDYMYI